MKPSITETRPAPMPAICLLGLPIPVWVAEVADPVLLVPVALEVAVPDFVAVPEFVAAAS